MKQHAILAAAIVFAASGALSACGGGSAQAEQGGRQPGQSRLAEEGGVSITGLFGGGNRNGESAGPQLGVNSFLWRATLDTLRFMPLASEDPNGGVIITDWYVDPERPAERFKAQVYILDTRLRADALNVSIFRQINEGGGWRDAVVDPQTPIQIENAILTRARQLRLSTTAN